MHTRTHMSANMIQVTVVITDLKCSWSWGYRGLPVTHHGHWELILGSFAREACAFDCPVSL